MKQIDFNCKKITLKDLIQCNYNLNESEYLVFAEILKSQKGLSVKELVDKISKDRTTIQKILTNLIGRKLLMKRQMNLDRGFMFVYFSKNKEEIINDIEKNFDLYVEKIKESISTWKSQSK